MRSFLARFARCGVLTIALATAASFAWAQDKTTTLFKIVTVKDEIVIGLNAEELGSLGGQDAGAVAKALAAKGELTVWQYAVRHAPNGELEQAPLRKIGLLANTSLRVEPYTSPLKVVPHE
ncbi:MAG TPA: hypothetical protein VK456_14480 [Xanthobacteraceae bacterium]|nr:hypothetical protein [Xanthobacteraceae bacterium]